MEALAAEVCIEEVAITCSNGMWSGYSVLRVVYSFSKTDASVTPVRCLICHQENKTKTHASDPLHTCQWTYRRSGWHSFTRIPPTDQPKHKACTIPKNAV